MSQTQRLPLSEIYATFDRRPTNMLDVLNMG